MANKDKTLSAVEQKLLEKKAKLTLDRIVEGVKERDGKTIHIEFALEKFENYVRSLDLNVSDTEFDYLKQMRVRMHDNNGLVPKHLVSTKEITEPSVIVVDFKARKVIKPT